MDNPRRRERIARDVKYREELTQGLDEALAKLHAYLKERRMNQTPERDFILSTIYHLETPFDIDALHACVNEQKGNVCRVTVYNSLQLFVEAGVVARFQPFACGTQYFEKCVGQEPHGYQICRNCGAIRPLSMKEITPRIDTQLNASFHLAQYCLYAIGLCATCYKEERHEVRIKQLAIQQEKELREKAKRKERRRKKRYTSIKDVKRDQEIEAMKKRQSKEKESNNKH